MSRLSATRPERPILLVLACVCAAVLTGCEQKAASDLGGTAGRSPGRVTRPKAVEPTPETEKPSLAPVETKAPSPLRFANVAKEAGVDFQHVSGMTEERYFPTANGSGVAIFDYDGDGWLDLYFVSNCYLPVGTRPEEGRNRLYRNLGGMRFEDVTETSGLGVHGFCHGVIAGDFDNDGDQDLFLATYHHNTLFLNNGDGTFRDVGREAGVAPPAFEGRLEPGGDEGADRVVIDAVPGLLWKVEGGEPAETLAVKARPGQTLVFRQADSTAARGIDLLIDPARVDTLGESESAEAVLRERGEGESGLYRGRPPLKDGEEPKVLATFEVVKALPEAVRFQCSEHRPAWSSGGAPIDYDQDGDLDFYVSNYGWWTVEQHGSKVCGKNGVRQYCSPKEVTPVKDILYRNDGVKDGIPRFTNVYDEVFVDTSGKRIPGRSDGHGFGVAAVDLNDDHLVDLYVANDMTPSFVYLNQGNGTLEDATEFSGAAFDMKGATQSGMGVDAEDIDGDGLPEIFKTNFMNEYNTLYQNLGHGSFFDQTSSYGLAAEAMRWVGWGCSLSDFNNDGWPDVFVTNGHVDNNYDKMGTPGISYEEPPLLYYNVPIDPRSPRSRRFEMVASEAGPYFVESHVGRGASFGDLDNDGDTDIVVNHKDGEAAVLRNDSMDQGHWLRFSLTGSTSGRDAIGTKIQVVLGPRTLYRQRKGGCGLEGVNDPRPLVGLGEAEKAESVIVRWPSGKETVLRDVRADQTVELTEPE